MRFLMYRDQSGQHVGAIRGERVVNVHEFALKLGGVAHDMLGLIELGDEMMRRLMDAIQEADDEHFSTPLASIHILPPLNPPRGNVLAVGRNYAEHAKESARARGEKIDRPTVFTKAQTSINGPYDDIAIDASITTQVDWEVELGVVMGRTGANILRARALDHVFGYTVVNDISARDIQYGWGGQFFKGKSLNGFCPHGPWIVTRDEIPDPQNLHLSLRVNGESKQEGATADMIFAVDELVAQLSLGMTLPAGTLIATGTPAGVGFGRDPQEFLKDGDLLESEVREIGILRNRIIVKGS